MVSKEESYRNSLFETLRKLEDKASDFVYAPNKDFTRMRKLSFIDTMKAVIIMEGNGNKLSIIINDELWMLKLPSHTQKNANLSYSNSSLSEYLGCHIFNMLGVVAQDTML